MMMAPIKKRIKYGAFIFSPFALNTNIDRRDKGKIHNILESFTVVAT